MLEIIDSQYRETLEQYSSVGGDIAMITAEQNFIKGFQLAVRLMVEAMNDDLCDLKDIAKK